MFLNKVLFACNIAKLSLTIDGIYYVVDDRLGIYHTKHHRNVVTETKINTRELQNMIEIYGRCDVVCFLFCLFLSNLFLIIFSSNLYIQY
jgi:hypothetical protein